MKEQLKSEGDRIMGQTILTMQMSLDGVVSGENEWMSMSGQ